MDPSEREQNAPRPALNHSLLHAAADAATLVDPVEHTPIGDGLAQEILDSMAAHVAVLGPDGRIRAVNRAWTRFAAQNDAAQAVPGRTGMGVDYVALCRSCRGPKSDEALPVADGIEQVLRGERSSFELEYPCDSPTETRWFAMFVTPLSTIRGAVVAHHDITARKLAELALATETRRREMAVAAAHVGVWTFDLGSRRIQCSDEVFAILGVVGLDGTIESCARSVHPEDLPILRERFAAALERRMPFTAELRIVRPGGEIRWVSAVGQVECAPSGAPLAVVGTVQDTTVQKRSEWALRGYNQVLELIALGADLTEVLERVIRLVEEQLPGALCSVLIADRGGQHLRFVAGHSLPVEYNQAVDGLRVGPKAGSCGTAAFRKTTVTVTDIARDPLWEDYRELAQRHGLAACVSVPILSSRDGAGRARGDVIGTFALYRHTAGAFDRLTYAILSGAEQLVRQAVDTSDAARAPEEGPFLDAAHLAGVAIERQQVEHAIREGEVRFRAVLDASPSAVYVREPSGRYSFVNRAMSEWLGVPPGAWRGKSPEELLPPELFAVCDRHDSLARATDRPVQGRHVVQLAERSSILLATHVPLRGAEPDAHAVCGILTDVTDAVAARQDLERLWQHAPDLLCVVGFDGCLRQINPTWASLLGWSDAEVLGRSLVELVHPDDRPGLLELADHVRRGSPIRGFENRIRRRDGGYRAFSWNAIVVPESQAIYGLARDVTEERRLAVQFQQAQKMEAIGQLASGVAHDFNNLLTVILGFGEMLLDEASLDASERESLSQLIEAGQRGAKLTSQLLALARRSMVEPRSSNVNDVVESSAALLRRLLREDVRLETRLGAIAAVKIDPGQLEQVFMNLAVNARDAMPEGGTLSITTERVELAEPTRTPTAELPAGEYVRISVADTGVGMTEDLQSRIFEPFFTTKGPGKGTGLGLATVEGIVRQAGGIIRVESAPGRGTTFHILFRADRTPTAMAPSVGAPVVSLHGSETILVVEDEAGVRDVTRAILEAQGYRVLLAASGAEALRTLTDHPGPVHLLLTDVVMPDVGGRALAEALCAQRPSLRVLYMSGHTDDAVLHAGVRASRDTLVHKPFTPLSLGRRVREVLDRRPTEPRDGDAR
jgi:PAS domain S-box-containing protein